MIEIPVTLTSTGGAVSFASPVPLGYTKNKGVYRLLVTAEGEWEGLTIRCFWHLPGGTDPASSLVQDGAVDVPASVTAHPGNGCITFEGSDGKKTVTSADLRYRVGSNSGTEDGTMPEPGTPAWEQLVSETAVALEAVQKQIGNLDDLTTKAKETLVAAINEAARTGGGAGSITMRTDGGYIQYSTDEGSTWVNLVALAELEGKPGQNGADGAPGADGYSPTASVEQSADGAKITITDKNGTTEAVVKNGKDGANGRDGADGQPGRDGVDGQPGKDGKDGITPTIGDNGNWYLGATDTGKPSRGEKGDPGSDASVTAVNVATAMGLSGLAADDQIMVSSVDADGKPTGWRKKCLDMLNVRDFGAKGDSTTDDTAAIQAALDAASTRGISTVLFPAGTYRVSATAVDNNFFAALTVHSGQRILFDAATLQLTANGYDFYAVLNIHNVNNVTVEGGLTIIGDREAHTATTGESGHGIRIVNSHNVHVSDVDIRYTWGDGVCVGGNGTMDEISENVTLERIRTYKCSRNGLSIIEADGVVVRDCDFTYTDRTAPQYGIDVEPNLGTATNITIENVRMLNNGIGGFALYTTKATQNGVLTLRNIETDAKTIIYTSSAKGGTFDVRVDGWRHTQKSGEANPTLRLSGKGNLRIRQLYVVNKSANRVIIPLDIENLRMDGVTVEDDPTAATHGTLSIQSAANTSIGKAVITGFLSRNPAEETWYSGNQLTVDNLQDTVVNLNEHLTTGGSSERYKLLLCDKALVLGTAISAKARVFIPYTYGNVNSFRVVNTTDTKVQLYTSVSAGITFVGDVPGGSSANSAELTGNASYEVTPMLASGFVYVRKLDTRVPTKTSDITNDSGYQTAEQVESIVTGKGYRTASEQDTIDSGKVDKVTGKGLSTNDYTDAAKAKVDALAPVATSGSYNDLTNKPTTLPNPNALTFTGAVTGSYDGSAPLRVEIPSGGGAGGEVWKLLSDETVTEDVTEYKRSFESVYRIAVLFYTPGDTTGTVSIRINNAPHSMVRNAGINRTFSSVSMLYMLRPPKTVMAEDPKSNGALLITSIAQGSSRFEATNCDHNITSLVLTEGTVYTGTRIVIYGEGW